MDDEKIVLEPSPCPFCGEGAVDVPMFDTDDEGKQKGYAVMCILCGGWGPTMETQKEAIIKWNRRAGR